MKDKQIIDINQSSETNFKRILNATKDTLNEAITSLFNLSAFESTESPICYLKYDYNSLYTTIVYSLLNILSITYTELIPQYKAIEKMPCIETDEFYDEGMNRKRVERIKKNFQKRNIEHANYLNSPEYTPKILATDSLWYALLSDFPILKRFLYNKEPIITKKFFEELNLVYDKINTYSGYDRFFLLHKLEMNSKLEMFYKVLSLIKKEKRSKKLPDSDIQEMISEMRNLHLVPYNSIGFYAVLSSNVTLSEVFHPIMQIPPSQGVINSIVFNTDALIDSYIKEPVKIANFVNILNFIHTAVVFYLCEQIENELSFLNTQTSLNLISDIQHCDVATNFFDTYVNTNSLIDFNKDCSQDITFQHFKKIYNIKTEKQ